MTDSLICNLAVFILTDQDPSKCTWRRTNSHCGHSVSFDSNKFPLASNHCLSTEFVNWHRNRGFPASRGLSRRGKLKREETPRGLSSPFNLPRRETPLLAGKIRVTDTVKQRRSYFSSYFPFLS